MLWHRVAPATIFPKGNETLGIDGALTDNGDILVESVWGPQVQGHLNPDGNYQLANGIQGNLFQDCWLKVKMDERSNPFVDTLKATARQRAVQGSEIPRIRQLLTSRGINGSGIKVGILDAKEKNKETGEWQQSPHTKVVEQTINDPIWGVAPGARVEALGLPYDIESKDLPNDSYQAFANDMVARYQRVMGQRTQLLQDLIAKRDPALRVLNTTWGSNRNRFYQVALDALVGERNENGYYKYPLLRQTLLGPAHHGTDAQKAQAVINAVDSILDNSPLAKATHAQYVEATRQAASAGITLVVSAANEGAADLYGLSHTPGSQLSHFAESPYVISVAAANTRQMPGNRGAYTVAPFSSRGDGIKFNPTIAAPGMEMGISLPQGEIGHNLTVDGTSFSTPFVCGVIAMMLQRNPYLTFDQIKAKLQTTAVKSPNYGPADYGAGFLNTEAAVLS